MSVEELHRKLPFLKRIRKKRREEIEEYFASAPDWLLQSVHEKHLEKGVTFIEENRPANMIYIVGEGTIKATELRIVGLAYDFMEFEGIVAMGGMEVIMEETQYRTTITTVTPCTMIVIPRNRFEKWLHSDMKAMRQEAKNVAGYLLEQGRQGRTFLFLRGAERLCMFFIQEYRRKAENGFLSLPFTRKDLSEKTGMSVATVNRGIEKLEGQELIRRKGHKICINEEQFHRMSHLISELLDE